MRRTSVYATKEETEELTKLAVALASAASMDDRRSIGLARKRLDETIYKHALSHGLPEIEGYYGCDISKGEFIDF